MLRTLRDIRILAVRWLAVMAAGLIIFSPMLPGAQQMRIEVAGLLGEKAVLVIDGAQKVLQIGDNVQGIKLIAVEQEGVTLEIDGQRGYYPLGSVGIGTSFSAAKAKPVERVYRDSSGMFRTLGSINGYPVSFLVDTGASIVAMNSSQAKRLGIQYLLDGEHTVVSTASGNIGAYNIRLENVAVGQIRLSNIEAVVIEGSHPEDILLGMSFLGRLNVKNENEVMMLEVKY